MSSRSASPKTPNSSFEDVLVLPFVERPKKKRQTFKQKIPNNLSAQEAIDLMIRRNRKTKKSRGKEVIFEEKIEKREKRMLENQQEKS